MSDLIYQIACVEEDDLYGIDAPVAMVINVIVGGNTIYTIEFTADCAERESWLEISELAPGADVTIDSARFICEDGELVVRRPGSILYIALTDEIRADFKRACRHIAANIM